MKDKLNFEIFYPHPPERVWQALTDSNALGKWLMPTDFNPTLGFRFRFEGPTRSAGQNVEGVVVEVQRNRRLTYTWDDGEDDAPGIVSWTLSPVDGGTRVTLEHRIAENPKPNVLIEAGLNWGHSLHGSLPRWLQLASAYERPRVPIVYVVEEPEAETGPKRRAGFRQEEAVCC